MDRSRRLTSNTNPEPDDDGIAHVTIDASKHNQTLIGFGAALAWSANVLRSFDANSPINDAAFRDLGLDILRLRDRAGRQTGSDLTDEVTAVARATASLGHAPKILLSSWSPPAALKASGLENCAKRLDPNNSSTCTLLKSDSGYPYTEFANYFVESLSFYAASGIATDYLSIQNEPNYVPDGWEGCHFGETETLNLPGYDKALTAVHAALANVAGAPPLIGPEPINLDNGSLGAYVTDATRPMLSGIAHHLYSGSSWKTPDSLLPQMKEAITVAQGVPLWQTEFDTQNDNGTAGGFETAWVIHNGLAVEGLAAFLYWGLIWSGPPTTNPSNALIWVEQDPTTKQYTSYKLRDQYYALRHFARFTDPGYVRVDAESTQSNVRVSAYLSPDGAQLTTVLLNTASADTEVQLDGVTGYSLSNLTAFRTTITGDASTSEYWQPLDGFDPAQLFTMPARSILTIVSSSAGAGP